MNTTDTTPAEERGQAETVAELRRVLESLDEFRSGEDVDDLERAYDIVARLRAAAEADPVPVPQADRAAEDYDEVIRFACRSCEYTSPNFRRTDKVPHDQAHARETGHAEFDMFVLTRTKSTVWPVR
ncbi:hypothetical protein ACL02S_24015 [Nocardia sp. 004]|uniref:hypothetical protein n=1 Tax=Nocardia sp. 004 TaxID=3385978 RepID=UPI00399FC965